MPDKLPQVFGRYVLTSLIGEGGMAEVYLATVRVAQGLTKRVVIKKVRRDFASEAEFTRMFVAEAKIALSLNHANIVQVFDFGQVHGAFYLAMELVEGVDLMRLFHAVCDGDEAFPPVIAAYICHQVASGLAYAHRKADDHGRPVGIVHRDVSPHNVMVSFEGQVKILDFGIARTRDRAIESRQHHGDAGPATGPDETIKGKVAYMSPEQAAGRPVDLRSDVYSLGVVMHELLTGRLNFRTKDRMAALERVRTTPLPPLASVAAEVPAELAAIVDRALARDPTDRFESARALQAELTGFLHRSDPVVDDEVLSTFVSLYLTPDPATYAARNSGSVSHEHGTSHPARPPTNSDPVAGNVVVTHVAIELHPLVEGESPVDPTPFFRLADDVAFKRDALVLRSEGGVDLVFGALFPTPDDADRAVRAAIALREDVGDIAPGLRLGVVVANVAAIVTRSADAVGVELKGRSSGQLQAIARAYLEGPVMVSGNLVESLSRTWRFGDSNFVEPVAMATLSLIDRELEHVAPLLGPLLDADARVYQPPGVRSLLYGRELELKTLRETFSEAIRARASRAVLVLGEPGIGKRALVERFVASLPRTACWVLRAAGGYLRRNVALGVFLELLTRFLGVDRSTSQAQITAKLQAHGVQEADRLAEALAHALGLSDAGGSDLDPFTRRDRLWRLVRRLIIALATRRPVLIVIENIHYIDEQSMLLLKEWIQTRHPWPILGLTTGRLGHRRSEMLRADPHVITVALGELHAAARRELIVRRFEDPQAANELADAILARTGGHPLFIEQVLASLLEKRIIGWNPQGRYLVVERRGAPIELPKSVEAALLGRVEELDKGDREILQAAAVLGRQFRASELAQLLERPVAHGLETLVARQFLEPIQASDPLGETLRFATLSAHEVCKASLPPETARDLHGRAAELVRNRSDYSPDRDDGPIADHLMAAERGPEAIEPAMRAAVRAYDLAGNVEAYYHLSQALKAMGPADPRRWEALLRRERILRAWGRRRAQGADVRLLLKAATDSEDPEQLAIAAIRLLRFYLEVGRIPQAARLIPWVEERVAHVSAPAPFMAVVGELRSELMFMQGDFEAAEQIARDALSFCGSDARAERQRCRLLRSVGQVKNSVGKFGEARSIYDEALTIARRIGNQRLEANLLNALGEVAGRSTYYQEAVDRFKAAIAIDRDLGDRYATGRKLANLGITYACIGLYRRAERCLRKALELHEAVGHPAEFNDVVVHLGEVAAAMGELDSARALLLQAARVAATRGDIRIELRARIHLAAALIRDGAAPADVETAKMIAEQVLSTARVHGLRTSRCRALQVLARLCDVGGDIEAAIALETEAVELVRAGAAPLDGVRSIHHLGRLHALQGATERAEPLLREAAEIVWARVEDLRDPDLRAGYLEQTDVQQILADGGRGTADGPSRSC